MAELNDKELNEVNGGVDPAGSDLNGWQDFLKKIGKGIKNITKPVVKSSGPLNPAIDNKDIPTDEETWLG